MIALGLGVFWYLGAILTARRIGYELAVKQVPESLWYLLAVALLWPVVVPLLLAASDGGIDGSRR